MEDEQKINFKNQVFTKLIFGILNFIKQTHLCT
jgi:hypothetical protein